MKKYFLLLFTLCSFFSFAELVKGFYDLPSGEVWLGEIMKKYHNKEYAFLLDCVEMNYKRGMEENAFASILQAIESSRSTVNNEYGQKKELFADFLKEKEALEDAFTQNLKNICKGHTCKIAQMVSKTLELQDAAVMKEFSAALNSPALFSDKEREYLKQLNELNTKFFIKQTIFQSLAKQELWTDITLLEKQTALHLQKIQFFEEICAQIPDTKLGSMLQSIVSIYPQMAQKQYYQQMLNGLSAGNLAGKFLIDKQIVEAYLDFQSKQNLLKMKYGLMKEKKIVFLDEEKKEMKE